jgi:hypothetical protein
MRSRRDLRAANSRCDHIVAAMPHPKPITNIVIALSYLGDLIRGYARLMRMNPETAANVLLGEAGAAFLLMGFLVAALIAHHDFEGAPGANRHSGANVGQPSWFLAFLPPDRRVAARLCKLRASWTIVCREVGPLRLPQPISPRCFHADQARLPDAAHRLRSRSFQQERGPSAPAGYHERGIWIGGVQSWICGPHRIDAVLVSQWRVTGVLRQGLLH